MLNISKQIYACWKLGSAKKVDKLYDAEIIPYGESAYEKRKLKNATVKHDVVNEYDNIPLPGFTVVSPTRSSAWNMNWVIIDPRGFTHSIDSFNLSDILTYTGITEGLIQDKCVWVRQDQGTGMILLPMSDPRYAEVVKNTELIENRATLDTINIGDTVSLQSGITGIYRGVMSLFEQVVTLPYDSSLKIPVKLRRGIVEVKPGMFHYSTDLRILKVEKPASTPITREESIAYVNSCIETGAFFTPGAYFPASPSVAYGRMSYATRHSVKPTFSFKEKTASELKKLKDSMRNNYQTLLIVAEDMSGHRYLALSGKHIHGADNEFYIRRLKITNAELAHGTTELTCEVKTRSAHERVLDNFKKFYIIVKHVKDETFTAN